MIQGFLEHNQHLDLDLEAKRKLVSLITLFAFQTCHALNQKIAHLLLQELMSREICLALFVVTNGKLSSGWLKESASDKIS